MRFAAPDEDATPVTLVAKADLAEFRDGLPAAEAAWLEATGFGAALGEVCPVPRSDGTLALVAVGDGDAAARARGRFHLAAAARAVKAGAYRLTNALGSERAAEEALGWLLAAYRFDNYRQRASPEAATLVAPAGVDAARIEAIAAGEALTRDLINTPAADMGPDALEDAARTLAAEFGAETRVVAGDDLLAENFPMIHAVGRAADRAPRLIDMRWGAAGPTLTLVGKGVCFDTGGLNLKPAASMGLMKKDMGGAATVLGLARMIMALGLELRLRVLIPAVENSVAGEAFRPQDILTSRKGLTVEINNTDAEGRLVLGEALAVADEQPGDCLMSMATLTGAARVAVGADIAPFYTADATAAEAVAGAGARVADPVWRMPLHAPYEALIEPGIADLDNAPKGGMAGSVTAALFLARFVEAAPRYLHFDIYGWQPTAAPARPVGGVGQGARAVLDALPELLGS